MERTLYELRCLDERLVTKATLVKYNQGGRIDDSLTSEWAKHIQFVKASVTRACEWFHRIEKHSGMEKVHPDLDFFEDQFTEKEFESKQHFSVRNIEEPKKCAGGLFPAPPRTKGTDD